MGIAAISAAVHNVFQFDWLLLVGEAKVSVLDKTRTRNSQQHELAEL